MSNVECLTTAQPGIQAPAGSADTEAAGRTQPIRRAHRKILRTFLIKTLGYTSAEALHEAKNLERNVSDEMVERINNHLRKSTLHGDAVPSARGGPGGRVVTKLSDAETGQELAVIRVSGDEPAMLAYLAGLGLTAETRLTVRKRRSYSDVTTVQIIGHGHSQEVHLGAVASSAVLVALVAR